MLDRIKAIAVEQAFARHLGIELVSAAPDEVTLRLPYQPFLGDDRVNGGAISALVDLAATSACWANAALGPDSRGATIGFSINYLHLVVASDLEARARVRRRGGSICVADVVVSDDGTRTGCVHCVYNRAQRRHRRRPVRFRHACRPPSVAHHPVSRCAARPGRQPHP